MAQREAKCVCGALKAKVIGDPVRNSVCHCLACKRRTGAAFSWNIHYPEDQVQIAGEAAVFTRVSDEGRWARFHFCATCGVTVYYRIELRPEVISIPAGTFADPDLPAPLVEVYEERRCPWLPALAPNQE